VRVRGYEGNRKIERRRLLSLREGTQGKELRRVERGKERDIREKGVG